MTLIAVVCIDVSDVISIFVALTFEEQIQSKVYITTSLGVVHSIQIVIIASW